LPKPIPGQANVTIPTKDHPEISSLLQKTSNAGFGKLSDFQRHDLQNKWQKEILSKNSQNAEQTRCLGYLKQRRQENADTLNTQMEKLTLTPKPPDTPPRDKDYDQEHNRSCAEDKPLSFYDTRTRYHDETRRSTDIQLPERAPRQMTREEQQADDTRRSKEAWGGITAKQLRDAPDRANSTRMGPNGEERFCFRTYEWYLKPIGAKRDWTPEPAKSSYQRMLNNQLSPEEERMWDADTQNPYWDSKSWDYRPEHHPPMTTPYAEAENEKRLMDQPSDHDVYHGPQRHMWTKLDAEIQEKQDREIRIQKMKREEESRWKESRAQYHESRSSSSSWQDPGAETPYCTWERKDWGGSYWEDDKWSGWKSRD